jgi:hypothetical protein
MSLYPVQDQPAAQSPKATVWSCVSGRMAPEARVASEISKNFAHRSGRSFIVLCTRLAAKLGNPEDRP